MAAHCLPDIIMDKNNVRPFQRVRKLTLPMLRLLLSKYIDVKIFGKPSKPCHVGIH